MNPRLPSKRVREVLSSGKRTIGERVVAFAAPGTGGVAFVAGRRVGRAVQRNRARRVIRAAWASVADQIREEVDVVLVAKNTISGASSLQLEGEIEVLLRSSGAIS